MQIILTSPLVEDQALHFYTTALGFQKKTEISRGTLHWLTVESPQGAAGIELVLEPMAFPPASIYQKALYDAGIPATAFITQDIAAEFKALKTRSVEFRAEPTNMEPITVLLFEDNCGNPFKLAQPAA